MEQDDGHDGCDSAELGREHGGNGDAFTRAEHEEREPDHLCDAGAEDERQGGRVSVRRPAIASGTAMASTPTTRGGRIAHATGSSVLTRPVA